MNKQTLVRTLIVAVPVGLVALVTGYIYRDTADMPGQGAPQIAAPAETDTEKTPEVAETAGESSGTAPAEKAVTEAAPGNKLDTSVQDTHTGPSAKPRFDVVGIEPTGETVVAGRSEAGAIVALTANGKVVGKSIANESGEWTIILDEPLKPGDYDVGLEVHDQSGGLISGSDERVAVSIPEGGKEQPLVVLNSPDGPSDILQKPESSDQVEVAASAEGQAAEKQAAEAQPSSDQPAGETVVAAAGPAQPAAEGSAPESSETHEGNNGSQTAEVAPEGQASATAQETASTPAAETGSSDPAVNPGAAVVGGAQPETEEQPAEPVQTAGTTDPSATASSTETTTAAAGPQSGTADTQVQENQVAGGTEGAAASAQPDNQASQAATGAADAAGSAEPETPAVTVEAVESEKDKVYVAGTGEPGSSVRVYVGEDYQGEAKVDSGGKWLVEGAKAVSEGNVEVRADMIGKDGGSVEARAAVVFEKEREQQIVLTKVVASGAASGTDGQGASVQKALPVVIIRKGDNLWRISRRLYGDGIRYTTIYQANKGQIRNPDLIYPGQVFLTPEGDLNWPKPAGTTGGNG